MAWAYMDDGRKQAIMIDVVMPTMAEVFKGYDAERYADFGCVRCHRPGAKQGEF